MGADPLTPPPDPLTPRAKRLVDDIFWERSPNRIREQVDEALPAIIEEGVLAGLGVAPAPTSREGRIYISGPMTGLPDFNYPAFHEAAARWSEDGWTVVNPADDPDTSRPREHYLRRDIANLLTVEAIVMLLGWQDSEGARLERAIALALTLTVYEDVPIAESGGVARADREAAPQRVAAHTPDCLERHANAAALEATDGNRYVGQRLRAEADMACSESCPWVAALGVGEAAPPDVALEEYAAYGRALIRIAVDRGIAASALLASLRGEAAPTLDRDSDWLDAEQVARVFHDLGENLFAVHDGLVGEPTCPLCEDRARRFLRGLGRA